MNRVVGYSEFYWEMVPWEKFTHPNPYVAINFYMYGWNRLFINGAHMLLVLSNYGPAPLHIVMELFEIMTTPENYDYLVEDIEYIDINATLTTKDEIYAWLF